MEFLEYLQIKKIDADAFRKAEADVYQAYQDHFMQMHPDSFTAQKLFMINKLRLKYPIKTEEVAEKAEVKATAPKPKMKPRPRPKV